VEAQLDELRLSDTGGAAYRAARSVGRSGELLAPQPLAALRLALDDAQQAVSKARVFTRVVVCSALTRPLCRGRLRRRPC